MRSYFFLLVYIDAGLLIACMQWWSHKSHVKQSVIAKESYLCCKWLEGKKSLAFDNEPGELQVTLKKESDILSLVLHWRVSFYFLNQRLTTLSLHLNQINVKQALRWVKSVKFLLFECPSPGSSLSPLSNVTRSIGVLVILPQMWCRDKELIPLMWRLGEWMTKGNWLGSIVRILRILS